jgi:repressor LexA
LIIKEPGAARAIQLVDRRLPSFGLPLVGNVAAGQPLAAIEQSDDRLEFNDLFGGPGRFALKVKGDSMIEDQICDGDYVIIRQQETAQNGEPVVAMIENEVTLKRFYRESDHIRLQPSNEKLRPIIVDDTKEIKILGVLVGVLRKC